MYEIICHCRQDSTIKQRTGRVTDIGAGPAYDTHLVVIFGIVEDSSMKML